jgi:RNA polymerase sigma-70 factor (ECF subfamily)
MDDSPETDRYEQFDDRELMSLFQTGDEDAFAVIVRRYQHQLLNFFSKMGVYTCDASDLVQDTFIRLFKYRDRYKPRAKLRTFLYMIARQIWIDALRKHKRKQEFATAFKEEQATKGDASAATVSTAADAVEALQRLPEAMRAVVVLNIYQRMRYKEIADVLGIAEGTVKSRMFHALRKLREEMRIE